ncbi:DUF4365 domain-containing protein [Flavobacterium chungbukense]|uniref:DUF4365 domain-containing protein n=1 Tax=Flavobacterium chungbukense TaxID=877464 RepID=A0ABP7YW45_9FLAO|nr:DUF4365 domain-containing protein [Flavobacterium chungbukense]MCC4923226.1 DUF4365 domain-containing protein [Flavobacterium chungbukense]
MRYNNIERLGVIETDRIITKQLGWIFRELPVADVGIDAIIEESENGNPTGKFIAAQIKTGKGNFYISDKTIIYYASRVHYHYWLNLNIPIVLIAHFPEEEETYWEYIQESSFRKTKKKWKIEIPKNKILNEKSKQKLSEIIYGSQNYEKISRTYDGKFSAELLYESVEDIHCISDATKAILKIAEIMTDLTSGNDQINSKFRDYAEQGLSDKDAQVKATIKTFGRTLNISASRLESEIDLFSELFSTGLIAYETILLMQYDIFNNSNDAKEALKSIEIIPENIDYVISNISEMVITVNKLPDKYITLKEAKKQLIEVGNLLVFELKSAKDITENLIQKIRDMK